MPPAAPPPPPLMLATASKRSASVGLIAGASVGAVAALCLLAFAACWLGFCMAYRRGGAVTDAEKGASLGRNCCMHGMLSDSRRAFM